MEERHLDNVKQNCILPLSLNVSLLVVSKGVCNQIQTIQIQVILHIYIKNTMELRE